MRHINNLLDKKKPAVFRGLKSAFSFYTQSV